MKKHKSCGLIQSLEANAGIVSLKYATATSFSIPHAIQSMTRGKLEMTK
jgi:hypothetical protein